jgi:hypothetical protein
MTRAALGFKARTGRAILVSLAGDGRNVRVIERSEVLLLPEGEFAPYHAAKELEPDQARAHVKRSIATARRLATNAIRDAAKRCRDAGHEPCGCGVLVGGAMPNWTIDEILAVHVRMHQAEGVLFRNVLVEGARACGIASTTLPDKTAIDAAAQKLGLTRPRLDAELAEIGKSVGPPWGLDQKEAAAAALVVIGQGHGDSCTERRSPHP